ncbi:glycoside hydrolase family 97 catalytic domain-containing protein [Pontiellaceae bacterium B12227]|nr:glycoside hydrolase family 97 catalytic domain-containing protein [Pontiellaceae bacterium B12227]
MNSRLQNKLIRGLLAAFAITETSVWSQTVTTTSPDGSVEATVENVDSNLKFSLTCSGVTILEPGQLGLTINGQDFGKGISSLSETASGAENDSYPWRGVKSTAVNRCNTREITVSEPDGNWTMELKVFNDGAAYRFVFPGSDTRSISQNELTRWKIPAGSDLWFYRAYDTASYEGIYNKTAVKNLSTGGGEKWMPLPLVAKLSDDLYLCISESGEYLYPGSIAGAMGNREIMPRIKNTTNNSFSWDGEIRTPWRTFMVGDLNALVNSDIIHNVAPPADLSKFKKGHTDWIKPGRCGWTWWSTATPSVSAGTPGMDWDRQKGYVDHAATLGFEYYLVDEGWEEPAKGWLTGTPATPWARLKELCDYADTKGVKIMVWRAWQDGAPNNKWPSRIGVETFTQREEFFNHLITAGVVGAKIDFMDSESKERLQFYHDCIEHAAQKGLMINFHGSNKPRGESRTWPNEICREGIYGMEFEIWRDLPSAWYSTVPFTRLLAGHGDFTPTSFNPDRISGTSFALQLAASIVTTSGGILCFADDMDTYINSKAFGIIKKIPVAWDETIVLPGSEIGETAAFARRKGNDWYIGIINGNATNTKSYTLDLSFLGTGTYKSAIYKDNMDTANDLIHIEGTHSATDTIEVEMRAKGGCVIYLTKETLPEKI